MTIEQERLTPTQEEIERLEELLAKAELGQVFADTHHTKDYAGRTHGFLRNAGELVPIAAFVLSVEGMSQDQGRARLQLAAEAINALPALLAALKSPPIGGEGALAEIVAFLRRQSDLGACRGNEAVKGSNKRSAFGGGSLALARTADAIESGDFRTNDNAFAQPAEECVGAVEDAVELKRDADEEEAYQLGVIDGESTAVQMIDMLTGGDGEYRFCTDHDPERHCPDVGTMRARIVERFNGPKPTTSGDVGKLRERLRVLPKVTDTDGRIFTETRYSIGAADLSQAAALLISMEERERGKDARITALEEGLDHYEDQFCEGWCAQSENCPPFKDCSGCAARGLLNPTPTEER